MFSTIETVVIIGIVIIQLVIAVHAYRQIGQMKSFLPEGRSSLALKEYEIPADKIIHLEPSQVVDKITYIPSKAEEESAEEIPFVYTQPRDEKGRFISKRAVYTSIPDDIEFDDEES